MGTIYVPRGWKQNAEKEGFGICNDCGRVAYGVIAKRKHHVCFIPVASERVMYRACRQCGEANRGWPFATSLFRGELYPTQAELLRNETPTVADDKWESKSIGR